LRKLLEVISILGRNAKIAGFSMKKSLAAVGNVIANEIRIRSRKELERSARGACFPVRSLINVIIVG
jgi:hypothetical protein